MRPASASLTPVYATGCSWTVPFTWTIRSAMLTGVPFSTTVLAYSSGCWTSSREVLRISLSVPAR